MDFPTTSFRANDFTHDDIQLHEEHQDDWTTVETPIQPLSSQLMAIATQTAAMEITVLTLRKELENKQKEEISFKSFLAAHVETIQKKNTEIGAFRAEKQVIQQNLAAKDEEIAAKDEEIAAKDGEIAAKDEEIAAKDEEITNLKVHQKKIEEELLRFHNAIRFLNLIPQQHLSV